MRINARLDEKRSERLEYLKTATRAGTSEVLKQAIDTYYQKIQRGASASALEILTATGFIGSGEGRETLSQTYKEDLAVSLNQKYGDR